MKKTLLILLLTGSATISSLAFGQVRVPAEWEPQAATWMQWPRWYENSYRPAFAEIIRAVQAHETVRLVVHNASIETQARNYLRNRNVPLQNVRFERMPIDSAWMRDNGPVWVEVRGRTVVEDWGFDGWGGDAGPYYRNDDAIPSQVAQLVSVPDYDINPIIHERGNLEFNGSDTLILNWLCWNDRNPKLTRVQSERILRKAFGVTRIVWLKSTTLEDITEGHVDGLVRFIDADTVVVPEFWDQNHPDAWVYEEAATICANAGLQVRRMSIPGEVRYRGADMAAVYVNWLVLNGAVVMPGFGVPAWDNAAKQAVESYFPGRQVYVVNTVELWYSGGSIHCVTNDQPVIRR